MLFRRGDRAGEMFYIVAGAIRLKELGVSVDPGELLIMRSACSRRKARLASAICASDGQLLAITEKKVTQLYFQNPRFGFYMSRLITQRLIEDLAIAQTKHARAG